MRTRTWRNSPLGFRSARPADSRSFACGTRYGCRPSSAQPWLRNWLTRAAGLAGNVIEPEALRHGLSHRSGRPVGRSARAVAVVGQRPPTSSSRPGFTIWRTALTTPWLSVDRIRHLSPYRRRAGDPEDDPPARIARRKP